MKEEEEEELLAIPVDWIGWEFGCVDWSCHVVRIYRISGGKC